MLIPSWLLFALLFLLVGGVPARAAEPIAPAEYTITFRADDRRLVTVSAHLPRMASAKLVMNQEGATHLPEGLATFVHRLTVTDAKGKPLPVSYRGQDGWEIGGAIPSGGITLHYEVELRHDLYSFGGGPDEAPYIRSDCVFWTGRALFVAPENLGETVVRFVLPKDWKVSAAWTPAKSAKDADRAYTVPNFDALTEAFVVAGTHAETLVRVGETEVVVAVGDAYRNSISLVGATVRSLVEGFVQFFGRSPKTRLLCVVNPDLSKGNMNGGVFGKSISALIGIPPTEQTRSRWVPFLSHEIFHTWNGTGFRPKDQQYWVSEGFTQYYAETILPRRLGILTEKQAADSLVSRYEAYLSKAGTISLVAAGEDKSKNFPLVYQGGCCAALALDISIRKATGNRHSLDDVMRALDHEFGGNDREYTPADLIRLIKAVAGTDFAPFFDRYINGKEPLPLDSLLADCGMTVHKKAIPSVEQALFGLLRINSLTGMTITRSSGAGYHDGDELTAVAGTPVRSTRDIQLACNDFGPGQVISVDVRRDGKIVSLTVPLGNPSFAYTANSGGYLVTLTEDPTVSPAAQAIWKSLVGG